MAAADIIVLDDVFLSKCVTKLSFAERIIFERVNNQFARAVRATYTSKPISLSVKLKSHNLFIEMSPYMLTLFRKYDEPNHSSDRHSFTAGYQFEQLVSALTTIFRRFKRLRSLQLCIANSWLRCVTSALLDIFERDDCFPSELRELSYLSAEASFIDCRLIEALSPFLFELNIFCEPIEHEENVVELWTTVKKCDNLRKLTYLNHDKMDLAQANGSDCIKDALLDCLKERKLKSFCSDAWFITTNWLFETFGDNPNLRHLHIKHYPNNQNFLHLLARDQKMQCILARLKYCGLDFSSDEKQPSKEDIKMFLARLPANCSLSIVQEIDLDALFKQTETALKFWLKMSEFCGKLIKLHLLVPLSSIEAAVEILSYKIKFSCLILTRLSRHHSMLKNRNATVKLFHADW